MSFEISPPWWRTGLFQGALFLAASLLTLLGWRHQTAKLRARQLVLEAEFREHQRLLERATRDALTGLWNRATILDVLDRESHVTHRTGVPLSVGLIDVDHFKRINDTYGHLVGDEVLRILARRLLAELRGGDWLGRFGGEELMMILPACRREELELCVERIRTCVADTPFTVNGEQIGVTISIGMARLESNGDTPEKVMARADAALYQAKRSGRNRAAYALNSDDPEVLAPASGRFLRSLLERVEDETPKRAQGSTHESR